MIKSVWCIQKNDNVEIKIDDKADEIIEKNFQSLLFRYDIGLETSMKSNDVVFNCIHLLYYICHKKYPNWGRSYVDSPNWLKNH